MRDTDGSGHRQRNARSARARGDGQSVIQFFAGTHEEVVVVLLAHAASAPPVTARATAAPSISAYMVARHLDVFATMRILVTSPIDSFTAPITPRQLVDVATFRAPKRHNRGNAVKTADPIVCGCSL